jgi:hypothetical protein
MTRVVVLKSLFEPPPDMPPFEVVPGGNRKEGASELIASMSGGREVKSDGRHDDEPESAE